MALECCTDFLTAVRVCVLICSAVSTPQRNDFSVCLDYHQEEKQQVDTFGQLHRAFNMFAVSMCFSRAMKCQRRSTKIGLHVRIQLKGFLCFVVCPICALVAFLAGLLLLLSHDVEKNPGPGQKTPQDARNLRQTSSRTCSKSDTVEEKQNSEQTSDNEKILAAISDIKLFQEALSTKLSDKLSEMEQSINNNLEDIRCNQAAINEDILALQNYCHDLKDENESLRNKIDHFEEKIDYLENQSRRNNLIVHGLHTNWKDTWDEIENKVKDMFKTKLKIDKDILIERAHHIGKAVVVKFLSFKDRELVLSKAKLLKDIVPQMYIHPDVSTRVRTKVRALTDMKKTYQEQNQKAFIRHDKLVTPDGVYTYNLTTEEIRKVAEGRKTGRQQSGSNTAPLRRTRREEIDTNTNSVRSTRHEYTGTSNQDSDNDSQTSCVTSEARAIGAVGGLSEPHRGRQGSNHYMRRGGKDGGHNRTKNFSDKQRFLDSPTPGHEWC